jgi:hypothetical protein
MSYKCALNKLFLFIYLPTRRLLLEHTGLMLCVQFHSFCRLCSESRLHLHIHARIKVDLSSYALLKGQLMEEDTLSVFLPDLNFIVFSICCGFAFLVQTNLTVNLRAGCTHTHVCTSALTLADTDNLLIPFIQK